MAAARHEGIDPLRMEAQRVADLAFRHQAELLRGAVGAARADDHRPVAVRRPRPRPTSPREPRGSVRETAMTETDLPGVYRDYIACLNERDWPKLARFVDDGVRHNGRRIGLSGYREMLERDCREIPDLRFEIQLLVADPPHVASRLRFDCTPKGEFLGLDVNGRKVSFSENVFYAFRGEKIEQVWSIIDKAAIEAQLRGA
jgi:predicted ester cyclase